MYMRESEELINGAKAAATGAIERNIARPPVEWNALRTDVRDAVTKYVSGSTHRTPIIIPVIMDV